MSFSASSFLCSYLLSSLTPHHSLLSLLSHSHCLPSSHPSIHRHRECVCVLSWLLSSPPTEVTPPTSLEPGPITIKTFFFFVFFHSQQALFSFFSPSLPTYNFLLHTHSCFACSHRSYPFSILPQRQPLSFIPPKNRPPFAHKKHSKLTNTQTTHTHTHISAHTHTLALTPAYSHPHPVRPGSPSNNSP